MAKAPGRPRGATRNPPRQAKSTGKAAPKKSPSLGVLLLCLLPILLLVWLLMRLESGHEAAQRQQMQKPPASQAEKRRPPLGPPPPKYDFYEELPKAGRKPEPAKAESTKEPKAPATTEKTEVARASSALRGEVPPPRIQYFLQAASFKSAEEAEQLRAQLALIGQHTRLEQGKVGGQTWHRVMVGPFASQQQLAQTRKQLAEQGFKQQMLSQQRKAP